MAEEDFGGLCDPADSEIIARDACLKVRDGELHTTGGKDGALWFTALDTSDKDAVKVAFDIRARDVSPFEQNDNLKVWANVDGDYVLLDEFRKDGNAFVGSETGQTFGESMTGLVYEYDLDGAARFELVFQSCISARYEVIRIDNVKLTGTDGDCGPVPCPEGSSQIDFNDAEAGVIVSDMYEGVTIPATAPNGGNVNRAMIFDTDNITGGDGDLAKGDGKVLIISEDLDGTDPDDNAGGGEIVFEFDRPAEIYSMVVVDTEEGGTFRAYDADGVLIGEVEMPELADGEVGSVELGFVGASKMVVTFNGSGALDDLCYKLDPKLASLGDRVWLDADRDGIQDQGEDGVAGVAVDLLDANGNVLDSTVTDGDGHCLFEELAAGDYKVMFGEPAGLDFTLTDQGGDDAVDSDADGFGMTGIVTLAEGEDRRDVDAGLVLNRAPTALALSGKVCATETTSSDALVGATDPDGDSLELVSVEGVVTIGGTGMVTLASGATVTFLDSGEISYDNSTGVYGGTAAADLIYGTSVQDSFVFTISDGQGNYATETATVTICGAKNTLETITDSLPAGGAVTYDLDVPVGSYLDLTIADTGDARFDGMTFGATYCLSFRDPFDAANPQPFEMYAALESEVPGGVLSAKAIGNLDMINWILNEEFQLMDDGNGTGTTYTEADIQGAIWLLTDTVGQNLIARWDPMPRWRMERASLPARATWSDW